MINLSISRIAYDARAAVMITWRSDKGWCSNRFFSSSRIVGLRETRQIYIKLY